VLTKQDNKEENWKKEVFKENDIIIYDISFESIEELSRVENKNLKLRVFSVYSL